MSDTVLQINSHSPPDGHEPPPTPGGRTAQPPRITNTPAADMLETITPNEVYDKQHTRNYNISITPQEHMFVLKGNEVELWYDCDEHEEKIPPKKCDDAWGNWERHALSVNWRLYTSPDGKPYFYYPEQLLYTNIHIAAATEEVINTILINARSLRAKLPEEARASELVIETLSEDKWGYYFAEPQRRRIFWVHNIWLTTILEKTHRFVTSNKHLARYLEALYWLHVEIFPGDRMVTQPILDELVNLLQYGYHDHMTSSTSTCPYSIDKCQRILKDLRKMKIHNSGSTGISIVARHMHTLNREMFIHYYGEHGARLNRDQSVHDGNLHMSPKLIFLICSPFLFYMPDVYLKKLRAMYVDESINETPWNKFWDEMRRDWERATTPVTVLLSTNVGFLAIQSIDSASASAHRSVAQIASYASTILSLACYLICWTLSRQHPPDSNNTASEAIRYLARRGESPILSWQADALIYSLPSALFTWSMLTFLVSITWTCFAATDTITRSLMAILLFSMTLIVTAVLHADWGAIAPSPDSLWKRILHPFRRNSSGSHWSYGRKKGSLDPLTSV